MPKPSQSQPWMIYGANGYTGALIAEEAVRRGLKPRLGGRNASAIEDLGRRLGLDTSPCDLHDQAALRAVVAGHRLVLHCAGPFS